MSGYGLTPYEPGAPGGINIKGGGHPALGKTRGQTFPMHIKGYDGQSGIEDEEEWNDIDDFVDDVVKKKITKSTDGSSVYRKDLGVRRDVGNMVTNVGGYLTMEFAGDHTTHAVKGLSPRLTYRSKTNTKGPSMNGQGRATYIRNKPGSISGTQFGTSRAPLPKHYEDDDNIWSLSEIDPHDKAMKRQNRIRNYIKTLEDI